KKKRKTWRKIRIWKKKRKRWMRMPMKKRMAQSGYFLMKGRDPLNPPPPASDSESNIEEVAPVSPPHIPTDREPKAEAAIVDTGRLVPLTRRRLFTNT
nr:hypothetical protein [Tanacetum cinerariifolium]